ncbi:hypothetical protein ANCDUO_14785 [Ancylostoma duodenale]|uniref:Uncharacterized protein n=1 Tax=Ancylostoma duodenale TaxID=51022 RepID=A0A0C2CZ06_9BILA|nr:hypothetical protein ANCDUO_14785 [Ancylostoma duodenale]
MMSTGILTMTPEFPLEKVVQYLNKPFMSSGIKIHEVVKLSSDPNNIKPEIKRANIKSLTIHLQVNALVPTPKKGMLLAGKLRMRSLF